MHSHVSISQGTVNNAHGIWHKQHQPSKTPPVACAVAKDCMWHFHNEKTSVCVRLRNFQGNKRLQLRCRTTKYNHKMSRTQHLQRDLVTATTAVQSTNAPNAALIAFSMRSQETPLS